MSVWSAVGMSAGSNSSNADRQNASGRLSLPEDADNKAVPLRHRHPHLQSAFVSVFGCLDGRRFTKGRTATNVGVAQTAAVSLVVGMMTLGMPVAALAAGPAAYGVDDGTHIPGIARWPTRPGTSWPGWSVTRRRSRLWLRAPTSSRVRTSPTTSDPQGPWLVLLRDAVCGDASKIDADNAAMNASLNP